jgi:hypothetical protein
VIEFLAGAGAGCFALLAFFRWLWNRNTDRLIQSGPCAHCRRLLDVTENGKDHEHWRVCPKHPARAEVESLRSALAGLRSYFDFEPDGRGGSGVVGREVGDAMRAADALLGGSAGSQGRAG